MPLFIRRFGVFLLLVGCIFGTINWWQTKYNIEPKHYKKHYDHINSRPQNDGEGMIIGSSHAVHGIRPSVLDQTGIRWYSYALNGTNPAFYQKWYNEYFKERVPKAKYCIYEIDWFMFWDHWLWRKFEHDAQHLPNSTFLKLAIGNKDFSFGDLLQNKFPFCKFKNSLLSSLKRKSGDPIYIDSSYDRGFIEQRTPYTPYAFEQNSTLFNIEGKDTLHVSISAQQVNLFEAFISELQRNNIQLIFVMAPECGIPVSSYEASPTVQYIQQFARLRNIPFLNYNTSLRSTLNDSTSNFSDWGHLSCKGSLQFSQQLAKDIQPYLK